MTLSELLVDPFSHYAFMRRALAACVVLSLGGAPLGVFMTLRRMTLAGDAISHAILPGIATAFVISGLSLWPMVFGGLLAGLAVAAAAFWLTRFTQLKEDATLTLFYLLSLAIGVAIVSSKGGNVNLLHLLFGNILAVNGEAMLLITGAACVSLFGIAVFYRWFVIEGFDPDFLQAAEPHAFLGGMVFYFLLMLDLVAAFQALGTLMALGLVILPAIAARFWSRNIDFILPLSVFFAIAASAAGLLVSFHTGTPSGSTVVLAAGIISLLSACCGPYSSVLSYFLGRQ